MNYENTLLSISIPAYNLFERRVDLYANLKIFYASRVVFNTSRIGEKSMTQKSTKIENYNKFKTNSELKRNFKMFLS